MELRILSMEKRGNNYWVHEAHPATPDKKTPTHTSEHTIASMRDYKRFQEVNNTAASYAYELGLDLSVEYPEFLKLGFRVCQQLEGRVKDFTMPKYWEAEWNLQHELKKGIARYYALKAHDELEKLASPELMEGVSEEDQATIADYVDRLQRLPFPKDKTGLNPYPTLPKEEHEKERSFESMISFLVYELKNMTNPTSERYARVPPEARAEFLALCRYEDLFGKVVEGDWFEYEDRQEELIGLVKGLKPSDTKKFLTVPRRELERDTGDFDEFYRLISYSLSEKYDDRLNAEQTPLFCELLARAQDADIDEWRESLPIEAIKLLGAYSAEEVLDITTQAFGIVRTGEMPWGFLKKKAEERRTA